LQEIDVENKQREPVDPRLLNIYNEYAHGHIDRREFMRKVGQLAVGGVTAAALAATVLPRYAEAQTISFTDGRIRGDYVSYPSPRGSGTMRGYLVRPTGITRPPALLVIHENRGLNPHIEDVARRAAVAGFMALAPDGLAPVGGYPGNDDAGRELQSKLDPEKLKQDMIASARFLKSHPDASGKLGATGFCWGGGMTNTLAVELGGDLSAGVPFYGPAPAPADVARIKAPLLIHYAEHDERINAMQAGFEAALKANNVPYEMHVYPKTNHGFHNNSTPRYDAIAADLAWQRTIAFLRKHLEG
jgi:carboxymethylenebutenolidase